MWLISIPKGVTFGVKDSTMHQHERNFKQCPPETVPFKRTKKEDLIRATEALEAYKARPNWEASTPPPGVHVNKRLYGDTATHTYSLWTSDGFRLTGCFNALCPGYVQVSKRRVMGQVECFVSTYAKTIYKRRFLLHKDTKSGNWWLSEYIANGTNEGIGYWPRELFPGMSEYAAMAQFRGKVYRPPKVSPSTPLGSGHFVSNDFV
ncbi:hypothetical protein Nepgr_020253 [Nepenthes gracilis]|uniref:Neprosin PEP catalytic domain-containing protein n=1 Tax=Nepenthes gracilis TaxID=150966 RepID=A0AAD3SWP9_NEPGR|nr:hypothetical protein Nepgr_020253 [Nepenthes gracilis]